MFTRVFIATLLTVLSNWAYGDEYAVITEQYTGSAFNVFEVKEKVVLTPGLVVRALSRTGTAKGHFALIEVIDREFDGVIWVPLSVLAMQRTFSPIGKWKEVKLEALAGDYLAHYHFYSNGTFSYRSYAENGKPFTIRGRLYKSKNILWAPRDPKREKLMKGDIFVVSPADICWPVGGDCSPVP